MTEVKKEGNVLNSKSHPEIGDNTINLVIPYHSDSDIAIRKVHLQTALSKSELESGIESVVKHPFNGDFYVLSFSL